MTEPFEPLDPIGEPEPLARRETGRARRPWMERIGLAAIAAVLAIVFGGVAAAAWVGGEPFLTVMAGVGCLMTLWVGGQTLIRG